MSDRAPYSRVYWSIVDDPKFEYIFDDDAALACWLRLLMAADAVWPGSAHLPRATKKRPLEALVGSGIVDLLPGHRYRIHGLDAEREKRKQLATTRGPSGDRPVTRREPNGSGVQGLSQAKPSTSRDEPSQPARADDPADAYWQLTGKYPTDKTLGWIDDLTSKFGHDAVIRALASAFVADRTVATLLGRTQDILRAESRELDRREREDEQRRLREKRAVPREEEPWRIEQRKAYLERYGPDAA